ncbi:MAG: DNA polymerase III subunit epsilon [Candidatus Thioglobus sp.]|nr:MAG: DNA polymerase III subunit epsilon [Candidatus Thioglobus sp.]
MDLIVLDTETTGLEVGEGHRVIEVGCVCLRQRKHTDHKFHSYLNPGRGIDPGAQEVHGISSEFLSDKPVFAEIADSFLEFIKGNELVIHNASFDIGFLNRELEILGLDQKIEDICRVTDSLRLAREMHPGQRNSLDALCRRYSVDNSGRELHGALLDAEILSDVYLAMTGGQTLLSLDDHREIANKASTASTKYKNRKDTFPIVRASADENEAHQKWIDLLGNKSLW